MSSHIKAKIIADSLSAVNGQRITTFELEYPRFIHSELMTHRLFSRNAMSSRAVPIEKMIEQVRTNPAKPVHWGKNQNGMQAKQELEGYPLQEAKSLWNEGAAEASSLADMLNEQGAHKQLVNRILEPFQLMKTVLTATEFDNFFWLRKHEDAQPEIKELADKMYSAIQENNTATLSSEDWHTPYFGDGYWLKDCGISLEDALAISSSCCAQVSYRLLDDSIEKARKVYQRLVESTPVHASPFEHQGTPMKDSISLFGYNHSGSEAEVGTYKMRDPQNIPESVRSWQKGITHVDRDGKFWSGNFKSWIQYRQLIDGNVCNKFEEK